MEEKKLYNAVQKFITLADGREIMIETGKLAKQADGSVVVKQGDTMLLATVVAAKDAKPDTDFMPLQVEYKEKYAACGRYPGGFMKRERWPVWPPRPHWPCRTSPSAARFRRCAWRASTASTASTRPSRRCPTSTWTSWSAVRSTTS